MDDGRGQEEYIHVAGRRIEAKPSWPTAIVPKFAEIPAPDPPEEPPTVRWSVEKLAVAIREIGG